MNNATLDTLQALVHDKKIFTVPNPKTSMGSVFSVRYPLLNIKSNAKERYVVFSYGAHFPMYVWDYTDRVWIGNSDKYSTTTSKHQSKCRPNGDIKWLTTDEINKYLHNYSTYTEYMVLRGEQA